MPADVLWIELNPVGTHAEVRAARADQAPPPRAHVLRPGEEFCCIGFDTWRGYAGRWVDVLHLQLGSRRSVPPQVPRSQDFEFGFEADLRRRKEAELRAWQARQEPPTEYRLEEVHGDAWQREPGVHGDPPAGAEYGYCEAGLCIPCSRDELAKRCADVPATLRVWTPQSGGLARPEEVPFLVEAHRTGRLRSARRTVQGSALALAAVLAAFVALLPPWWPGSLLALVPGFIAVTLLAGAYELREARGLGPEAFAHARAALRHAAWVGRQPQVATRWLLGLLIVVMLVRAAGGDAAVEAAGLVKPAVREGEAWRLLTGPLLHANFTHIWMNGAALLGVGPLIEVHGRRGALPLVFLVSALGGSLLSLILLPDTTSVGASGGIMGMIGFLGVFGLRNSTRLPPGFARGIGLSVAATAVLGLVGIQLIDNAAHLGGLLTGALLGHFLTRPGHPEAWTEKAGRVALAATFAGGALAVGLILAAW